MSFEQRCFICNKVYTPDLAKEKDFSAKYRQWKTADKYTQEVWPEATAIQREQLQSGICSDECWDSLYPDEPDDYND